MLDPNDLIGRSLHEYVVTALLGSGGFGWVYRVHHPYLEDRALKVLYPWLAREPAQQERFRQEALTGDRLHHESIVPVYDMFEQDGLLCIAMMLIDPPDTLAGHLRSRSTLPVETAVELAHQIAAALDHAHRNGVIHRDVTPNNILIRQDGRFMLGDFGIARLASPVQAAHSSHIVGTPAYLSPEQLGGAGVDRRSDLYQLALVLYQVLTGRVRTGPLDRLPPASTVDASLPGGVDAVLERALALDPAERPDSAGELAGALAAELTQGRTMTVRMASVGEPWSVTPAPGAAGRRLPRLPVPPWRTAGVAAAGVLAAALVAGALWSAVGQHPPLANLFTHRTTAAPRPVAAAPTPTATPTPSPTPTPAPSTPPPTPPPTPRPAPAPARAAPPPPPTPAPPPAPPVVHCDPGFTEKSATHVDANPSDTYTVEMCVNWTTPQVYAQGAGTNVYMQSVNLTMCGGSPQQCHGFASASAAGSSIRTSTQPGSWGWVYSANVLVTFNNTSGNVSVDSGQLGLPCRNPSCT